MRTPLGLLLFLTCTNALAEDRCFHVVPNGEITVLPSIFPDTLILKDQLRDGLFSGEEVKILSWIGPPSGEFYSDFSHWETHGDSVIAVLRSEFDGFRFDFDLGTGKTSGTAQPFVDIPGERPTYVIQVTPVDCPQA